MKIALIVKKMTVPGGVQRQALSLGRELVRMGHEVKVYTFDYSKDCLPDLVSELLVVELPKNQKLDSRGFWGLLNETRMAKRLAFLIDKDTELLHPHDVVAHHTAYFFKKHVKNIPSVWNMNELPSMRWPLEMLSFVEDPRFHDIPRRPLWFKKIMILLRTYYDNFFVRKQDLVTVFDSFHRQMLSRYAGIDSVVVPSGTDTDRFVFVEHQPPTKGEKIRLLSSGIFTSYRRFEDLLQAVHILIKKNYDIELTVLGKYDGDKKYFLILKKMSFDLGIGDRVSFLGGYSDDQLISFFEKNHIFIFPHMQSQGLSVYEAMLSGIPCVVSPIAGTYETLTDKEDAVFAEPKNPDSLSNKIELLITNPELYKKVSQRGSEKVRQSFSWGIYAENMIGAFRQILPVEKI